MAPFFKEVDMNWTPALQDQLLRLHRAGLTHKAISKQMGLKLGQVQRKCYVMGLTYDNPGQPSPKKRGRYFETRRGRDSKPKFKNEDPKDRKCLKCRVMFFSTWIGERICGKCKDTKVWQDPDPERGRVTLSRWTG